MKADNSDKILSIAFFLILTVAWLVGEWFKR